MRPDQIIAHAEFIRDQVKRQSARINADAADSAPGTYGSINAAFSRKPLTGVVALRRVAGLRIANEAEVREVEQLWRDDASFLDRHVIVAGQVQLRVCEQQRVQ